MKNIGFLSFGHWAASPHSGTRSASDALLQSIDLASPFPLLAADWASAGAHRSRWSWPLATAPFARGILGRCVRRMPL